MLASARQGQYEPILIEQTSKPIKGRLMAATLIVMAGTGCLFWGVVDEEWPVTMAGLGIILIGLIAFLIAKFQQWWHHE
jgi:hypothetical protein